MKLEMSEWSPVNSLKRSDVSSAIVSTITTATTTDANRTVVRRRLGGSARTTRS
jgi:hypothetical protein